jgi:hypothetical protein
VDEFFYSATKCLKITLKVIKFFKPEKKCHKKLKLRGISPGLQIEGVLVYFMHLKHQKRIGDDVCSGLQKVFTTKHFFIFIFCDTFYPPIMQEYDSKCLKLKCIVLP